MKKIEKLKTKVEHDKYRDLYDVYHPSKRELMEKINEIIDVVNTLIKNKNNETI